MVKLNEAYLHNCYTFVVESQSRKFMCFEDAVGNYKSHSPTSFNADGKMLPAKGKCKLKLSDLIKMSKGIL